MEEHLVVPPERWGMELDEFLCLTFPLLNKGFLRRQIREGRVLVDGQPAQPSQRVRRDHVVSVSFDDDEAPPPPAAPTERVPVLYEDDAVLAVDKPAALAVEPERWARDAATLSGALLELALDRAADEGPEDGADDAPGAGDRRPGSLTFRPRLVHRIDKDTTGVVLVAKTLEAERELRAAFEDGRIEKEYLALVDGEFPDPEGEWATIDHPIAPDARRSGRMCVRDDGKPSVTDVRIETRYRGFTLLRCRPRTGRTHQIRVHLSHEGFPLTVDPQYGRRDGLMLSEIKRGYRPKRGRTEQPLIGRLTLHAASLTFPDVRSSGALRDGDSVRVESPLPRDFQRALKQLGKVRNLRK